MLRKRRRLLLTAVGLILFIVYLAFSNPFKVLMGVGRFNFGLFLLSVLINYLGLVLFAVSWYLLLRGMDVRIRVSEAIRATFISLFVVWMIPIPVGTEIIRAYLVRNEENSDTGKAIASVVVHKAMYNISFGILIAFAATIIKIFYGANIPIRSDLLWFVILFAVGSSLLFAAILDQRLLRTMYRRSPPWIRSRLFDRMYDKKLGLSNFDSVIDEIGKAMDALKSRMGLNFLALLGIAFH